MIWMLVLLTAFAACRDSRPSSPSGEKVREYANELFNRNLHTQAVDQYRVYLEKYAANNEEKAGILYRISDIYFERLHDYENALAELLKIKTFFPESKTIPEVKKKIIACLERLGRPEDASQALRETADLVPAERENRPGNVVAVIGNRTITQGDLDFEISQLPPEVRSQFQNKEQKLAFLKRFVATELIYDSAKREGLDKDKDVLENTFQAKKTFMVQKLLQQKIMEKVRIEEQDIELYYKANQDRYREKDKAGRTGRLPPLSEIQERVARDLFQERQQKAYTELLEFYLRSEDVKIFDDLVK